MAFASVFAPNSPEEIACRLSAPTGLEPQYQTAASTHSPSRTDNSNSNLSCNSLNPKPFHYQKQYQTSSVLQRTTATLNYAKYYSDCLKNTSIQSQKKELLQLLTKNIVNNSTKFLQTYQTTKRNT
ncbi:hypothetical protein TVAGG3_0110230 [Trichomonas vaginalis G3]|uniref:hypothetical protein n=1 Tax=Trichomonas vaginalis (strain ATCC PRA-98 / G3) TaxID=412133 RepID=UPI0021E5B21A|nr:hypothetical protein TVAGG3_0110230 [Trichomonas vaginalis G3]KAI5544905.1 hypothetical protein TVAGG3_0110230 [Trichomonas vaginalis G3]